MHTDLSLIASAVFIALIPFVFVLMTSFTRVSIILTFLKQALSTTVPSSQIVIGLSLILTGYIMHPVMREMYDTALKPYMHSTEKNTETLITNAWPPLRTFMVEHTREKDIQLFCDLAAVTPQHMHDIPWYCVIPSFVISELRCAFLLGFLLFLPFLVIDMVVSSILMSMGMIFLPPVTISFPFKILLFVVVDGWRLIVQQIIHGYNI